PPAPAAVVVAKTQPVPDALAAIQAQPTSSTTSAQTADQSGAIKSTAVSLDADAPGPAPASMASSTLAQPAIMGAGQIYLQFGAFSGNENARHLAQKLNQKIAQVESRNAFVQTESQLHKVQIGPYPTRTAAVNASLRIQQETGIQPSITLR
ncbi:MAG TPA: SPOR domain-containing protein, partial [Eoetvoesiella sp.]